MAFRNVNRAIPKVGATDFARGRILFSADIPLMDPLFLRVVRSSKIHARILSISGEKTLQVPGVIGFLTSKDIPGKKLFGLIRKDQPLLARDRVRFLGEAIAIVAGESERAAQAGLEAVQVKYEELPSVSDPVDALDPGAPLIHGKTNLLLTRTVSKGRAAEGLARSYLVLKRTYRTPHLEHCYIEPDAGVGYLDSDGTYVIHCSTQNPHYDQKEVSEILGVEREKIRIIQAATGGGFGSKLDLNAQGFIALALHHFKRPVRLAYTREESFIATTKRHPLTVEMETGAEKGGRLLALRARCICDTGAYASYGPAVATRAAVHATGPYEIENVEVESLLVYTNNPVSGAMRGFGVPQIAVAHESQMDLMAQGLGMDPLEIRRINALRPGSLTGTGQKLRASVGILSSMDAIEPYYREAMARWKKAENSEHRRRGVGIGAMWYGIGNTGVQNPSSARIEMDSRDKFTLYTGSADIGQGSSTILGQIASEVLGIDPELIGLVAADTNLTTNAGATSASRQTYISGNAVKDAAEKLAGVLITEAADVLKVPSADLELREAHAVNKKDASMRISINELAHRARSKGRPLTWQGHFNPETVPLDPSTGKGLPYATYAFACHLAMVTVDVATGKVHVSKIVAVHDVGRAINPQSVEGQIHGGVAMGIGFALTEQYIPGETKSMADYYIPTSRDMPEIIPIIIEIPEPTGPFGAKGVGEPALIPTAPAVLNALADALGDRIYDLPATVERVIQVTKKAFHKNAKEE